MVCIPRRGRGLRHLSLALGLLAGHGLVAASFGACPQLAAAQADAVRLDLAADARWSEAVPLETLNARRERLRADFARALGGFPERCDLDVQVRGCVTRQGYRVEKLLFTSVPGHHVTAHLFLPDDARSRAPYPAILMPCGHDDEGKASRNHQRAAVIAAQAGFAALLYDPLDQGERLQQGTMAKGNVTGHVNAGLRAHLLGWGFARFRIWDGMRALDVLSARPDIDPRRIGVAGMSGGGTLSAYLFALDDRLAAGCPMGFITNVRSLATGIGPQDCEQIVFGQLTFGLNHLGLMAAAFPRPVCPGFTYEDMFPYAGSLSTWQQAQALYSRHGFADRVDKLECPGKHGWYESEKFGQTVWMRRWLREDPSALPFDREALNARNARQGAADLDYGLADSPEAEVVPGGVMSLPGEKSVYDLLADEADRLVALRTPLTREKVRAALGGMTCGNGGAPGVNRGYWFERGGADELAASCLAWKGENLLAYRVAALIATAKAHVSAHPGERMSLRVAGTEAIVAAHAFYLEPALFLRPEIADPPPSWREAFHNPELPLHFQDVAYGAFRDYDWTDLLDCAQWIAPASAPTAERDVAVFRGELVSPEAIAQAKWRVSSLGVMRVYVNGREVGAADILKPGLTDVLKRRAAFTYDVTELLDHRAGATNRLEAVVAASWWRDQIVNAPGTTPRTTSGFRGLLAYDAPNGVRRLFPTEVSTWRADYTGPVVRATIFDGEAYDARRTADVKTPAVACREFAGVISSAAGGRVMRREDLARVPVRAYVWQGVTEAGTNRFGRVRIVRECVVGMPIELVPGETLVADFGQNIAGVPDFDFAAAAGTTVTAASAEMLNDACGEQARGNDGPAGSVYRANYRAAKSTLSYTFGEQGRSRYTPGFTFFGGRYWSVTATDRVTIHSLRFTPLMSVAREQETLELTTGHPGLNQLISNCVWGMRGNYLSVPTDCPQRDERQGWTGDAQVYSGAAVWNADVRDFLAKWMADMRDGVMTEKEPYPGSFREEAPRGPAGPGGHRIGWSDAGIIIPHRVWRQYGDTTIVRDNWEAMCGYLALLRRTEYRTAKNDYQYADWLSFEKYEQRRWFEKRPPEGESEHEKRQYWDFLGACHRIRDLEMMAEMAQALGREESAARFRAEAAAVRTGCRREHLTAAGLLPPQYDGMQTPALFALATGIVEGEAAKQTGERLLAALRANGHRIQTGFLGTSILLETLTDVVKAPAAAYSVLLNRDFPGWLYSVDQGATTIWERWNSYTREKGFGPVAMNSFNHYAYGAVEGWMVRTMAGIRPGRGGGFTRFSLAPCPDPRVGFVRARYRSPQGEIVSEWRYDDKGVCRWRFAVPTGTTADVVLPDGSRETCAAGAYERVLAVP